MRVVEIGLHLFGVEKAPLSRSTKVFQRPANAVDSSMKSDLRPRRGAHQLEANVVQRGLLLRENHPCAHKVAFGILNQGQHYMIH